MKVDYVDMRDVVASSVATTPNSVRSVGSMNIVAGFTATPVAPASCR